MRENGSRFRIRAVACGSASREHRRPHLSPINQRTKVRLIAARSRRSTRPPAIGWAREPELRNHAAEQLEIAHDVLADPESGSATRPPGAASRFRRSDSINSINSINRACPGHGRSNAARHHALATAHKQKAPRTSRGLRFEKLADCVISDPNSQCQFRPARRTCSRSRRCISLPMTGAPALKKDGVRDRRRDIQP